MRILYVTPYVPSKIRVRPYNLIKQLSARNQITLVALVQSDMDRRALSEMSDYCEHVYPVAMTKRQSVVSCAKRLLTKMPLQAAYTYHPSFIRIVDGIVKREKFDVVHVEHIRGAHYAAHLESLPKVYDSVDCITLLLHQFLATKRNPFAWFLTLEEWAKMRVYEAMMSQKFDKVIITSNHDKKALDDLIRQRIDAMLAKARSGNGRGVSAEEQEEWRVFRHLVEMAQDERLARLKSERYQVSVIPNGVDFDYFRPVDTPEDPDTVVISGKMSYYANVQAAHYFYERILPVVRRECPNTRFKIVGAEPPPSILKLARHPQVEVTGYVDDIRPHIASAAVAVCPIGVGVGIQNKLLEAMSMGKPVVATSKACRAVGVKNGRDLVVASDPEEFAGGVMQLLRSQDMRRRIGSNAIRYVRDHHSWQAITRRLEDVYEEAHSIFEEKRLTLAGSGG